MRISPRRSIVELAYYLGTNGDDPAGPVHSAVTEGRSSWYGSVGSTSCGDLLHCLAYAAGCRETWVNRKSHNGWRPGENLSVFVTEQSARTKQPRLDQLTPGDWLVYDYSNGRAHGCVYLGVLDGQAITVDAGQPGVLRRECDVVDRGWGPLLLRGRPLDFSLNIGAFTFAEAPLTVSRWCADNHLPDRVTMPSEYLAGQWEGM